MRHVLGIDVGGMSVKFSIVDEAGHVLDQWRIPTNTADAGSHIPDEMVASIRGKIAAFDEEIVAIGVGVPGPVAGDTVKSANNLGWENMPLGRILSDATGLSTVLLNDANAAALGEAWMGGKGAITGNAVFVTLGTGVGGGIVVDGKVIGGNSGCGGEIGHIPVAAPTERKCGCGKVNCLECYASATGILKNANEFAEAAGEERRFSTGEEIFAEVEAGGETATKARDTTVEYLAQALAGIMCTVDPAEVIVGGGLSGAGDLLMQPLGERLERYVFPPQHGKYVLRRATLGNDAGILGAAYQAFSEIGAF